MNGIYKKILLLCFLISVFSVISVFGQEVNKQPASAVEVLSMNKSIRQVQPDKTIDFFYGEVVLKHEQTYIYCDSATLEGKLVHAWGNVVIRQGDTLAIFSDLLHYDGNTRMAELDNRVVLQNKEYQLYTERLLYNAVSRVASYSFGATLSDGKTIMRSKIGKYVVDADDMFFNENVEIADPDFKLKTDSLQYSTDLKIAKFLAPTRIVLDSAQIYTEGGFYNIAQKLAYFDKNPQYQSNSQKAKAQIISYDGNRRFVSLLGEARYFEENTQASADTMFLDQLNDEFRLIGNSIYTSQEQEVEGERLIYNKKNKRFRSEGRSRIVDKAQILESDALRFDDDTGLGIASGKVMFRDTVQNLTIFSSVLEQQKERDYARAYGGRPILMIELDDRYLYVSADTLISNKIPVDKEKTELAPAVLEGDSQDEIALDTIQQDSAKVISMFGNVQIFRDDVRGWCDSLVFNVQDSLITLFKAPVLWSDSTQFTGDTIQLKAMDGKIHRIWILSESLVIMGKDTLYYDQIAGRKLEVSFEAGKVRQLDVLGNAQTIYYARDADQALIGVNQKKSGSMKVWLGDNQVETVRFYGQPDGQFLPMGQADHIGMRLSGFAWLWPKRPIHPANMTQLAWIDWASWYSDPQKEPDVENQN
jgi:lipopolysaccharide export system protein LptA